MALTVIKLNKLIEEQMANKPKYQKFGYTLEPSYADKQELKRLQLVPKGDKVT
jgi:hypothetical protein